MTVEMTAFRMPTLRSIWRRALMICTLRCETNAQCAAIPDAVCTPIRRGLAVCL